MVVPEAAAPVVGLWDPGPYDLTRLLLKKGLALTYLLAFLAAARQFRPLAGEDGLLPEDAPDPEPDPDPHPRIDR
ncbi:hypothetical protein BRD00_01445 [Halobacteriales archaeon QS_8_69_26]|nr:MAG: hypothetical protein BRD00_01445 [Halobacteriales archaeon QS_8_69_26]